MAINNCNFAKPTEPINLNKVSCPSLTLSGALTLVHLTPASYPWWKFTKLLKANS